MCKPPRAATAKRQTNSWFARQLKRTGLAVRAGRKARRGFVRHTGNRVSAPIAGSAEVNRGSVNPPTRHAELSFIQLADLGLMLTWLPGVLRKECRGA